MKKVDSWRRFLSFLKRSQAKVRPSSGRFVKLPFFRLPQTRSRRFLLAGGGFLAFMLPIVIASLLFSNQAEANWFDDAYGFRQRVPVANSSGSTQTDFQVELSLDTATLITAGKLQADCDDLRFTARDGKVLNYWLEPNTCNTSATKVFVKVPSIPTSGADIFWYYGNVSESSGSTIDQTFISEMPGPVAAWPLDDTTTTQSYARVVNPSENLGRELITNGGFDTDSGWTKGTGFTIANGVLHSDGTGGLSERVRQTLPTLTGNAIQVTFTISNYVSGSIVPFVGNTSGTPRSSNGTFTEIVISSSTPSNNGVNIPNGAGFAGDIDNLSFKQVNIHSSSTLATNLLTDGDMEASGTSSWSTSNSGVLSKQNNDPHGGSQVMRLAHNGVSSPIFSQANLTVGNAYRLSGYMRSGDGVASPRVTGAVSAINGSTSTSWQPFDIVFVAIGTAVQFQINGGSTGQYAEFDDVVISEDTTIRPGELLQDGNMEAAGTSAWTAGSGAVISKQTTNPFGGSQVLRVTRNGTGNPYAAQNVAVIGKRYRATGYMRSDGNAIPFVSGSSNWKVGTNSTDWQYFDVTVLPGNNGFSFAASTIVDGQYVEFDSISVTELSPLVGLPTNGVTPGASSGTGGHLATAYSFDGTNDNVNIYSSDLNSVFNPDEGTVVAWAKVSGAGVWTDGTDRRIINIGSDGSNQIILRKFGSNFIGAVYYVGGTYKEATTTTSTTDGFLIAMTWNTSDDMAKLYINGIQAGTTLTGLGDWAGNLSGTTSVIGSGTSSGAQPWSGLINDVRLYDRALSSTEVASLYSSSGDIQAYNTSNYTGKDLLRKFDEGVTVGTLAAEEIGAAPVAYWKFDEGQGQTVQDSSNENNDGTLGASTSSSSDDPTWITEDQCVSGKCLRFDNNDYVKASPDSGLTTNFTVSGWVKTTATGTWQTLYQSGTATNYWRINIDSNNKLDFTENAVADYPSTTSLIANQWNHIEIVKSGDSGTNLTFYINGLPAGTASVGTVVTPSGTAYVGASSGGTVGFMDEFTLYPYARSAAQVKEDFNLGAARLGAQDQTFLSNGLVGYWKMDEASWNGTASEVVDASGNGNHSVAAGGATTGAGKFGNGGTFDGTDDNWSITSPTNLTFTQAFTISAWVKTGDTTGMIAGRWDGIQYGYKIAIGLMGSCGSDDGKVRFALDSNGGGGSCDVARSSATALNDNQWHHVVGVYNGPKGVFDLYIDGSASTETLTGAVPPSVTAQTRPFYVGAEISGTRSLQGSLDETRIYNRALSPAEVKDLYNYAPGPVGHWKFDEGTGTSVVDSSGNGNNGTLTNFNITDWTSGRYGNALNFDGTDHVLSVPNTQNLSRLSQLTYQAWVKPNTQQTSFPTIMAHRQFARILAASAWHGQRFSFDITINGTMYRVNDPSIWETNRWYFVTGTYDGGSVKLYVDGVLVDSEAVTGSIDFANNDFIIGSTAYTGTVERYTGLIDDVRIYNYARSPAQILEDMGGDPPPSIIEVPPSPIPDDDGVSFVDGVAQNFGSGADEAALLNDGAGAAPVAEWNFDEKTGTTASDTSGNGNTGTLTGGPTWGLGKVGSAVQFDGVDDYVTVPDSSSISPTVVTLSLWFKPKSAINSSTPRQDLLFKQSSYYLIANIAGNGSISLYTTIGGVDRITNTSQTSWNANTWYHLVGTYDGTTHKLFVNGQLSASNNYSGSIGDTANALSIGSRGGALYPFAGSIDQVKIYNYARTPAQVAYDYNRGAPVAWWRMDECEDATIKDHSGNGNTGTLTVGGSGSQTAIGTCGTSGTAWGNGASGKLNASMSFDGTDDYVDLGQASKLDITEQITLSAWVKLSQDYKCIICKWQTDPGAYKLFIQGGKASFRLNSNGGITQSVTSVNDGNWHHVVGTYDRQSRKVYVDGKLEASSSQTSAINSLPNENVYIGKYGEVTPAWFFNGQIDDVRIYNYALGADQVKQVFNQNSAVRFGE